MLILTRSVSKGPKQNIKIILPNEECITIAVLGITMGQVKLGIDAPKNIPVHREEIFERIQNQKESEGVHECERNGDGNGNC